MHGEVLPLPARSCNFNEVAPVSEQQPRRRRAPAARSNGSGNRTVVLGILVVAVGLGVGVLSSVMMHRGGPSSATVPLPPSTRPPGSATAAPTFVPPTSVPSTLATPTPLATATPTARPTAQALATPRPLPSASPHASATPKPLATAAPTLAPTKAPPPPTAAPATAAPVAPVAPAANSLLDSAQSVVRRYVTAVMNGDATSARTFLGGSAAAAPIPELQFALPTSRIVSIIARRTGDSSAAVEVELANGAATYLLVYGVSQTASGYIITGRDITRPN